MVAILVVAADEFEDQRRRQLVVLDTTRGTLDRNASGSVEYDELPAALVFEFFRGNDEENNAFSANLVSTDASAPTSTPAAPAWFTGMDYNGDGDISRREFLGTPEQFAGLDTNGDGFLAPKKPQRPPRRVHAAPAQRTTIRAEPPMVRRPRDREQTEQASLSG